MGERFSATAFWDMSENFPLVLYVLWAPGNTVLPLAVHGSIIDDTVAYTYGMYLQIMQQILKTIVKPVGKKFHVKHSCNLHASCIFFFLLRQKKLFLPCVSPTAMPERWKALHMQAKIHCISDIFLLFTDYAVLWNIFLWIYFNHIWNHSFEQ